MKLHVILLVVILLSYHVLAENSTERTRGRYGITYGSKADFSQYSYFVKIWLKRGTKTYFCGGCIIDYNKILTAAHCVYGSTEFLICIGNGNTYDSSHCFYLNDLTKVSVTRGFHEGLKSHQFYDDLAFMVIKGNFFQTVPNGIALAPLCSACHTTTCANYEGSVGIAIGCGETESSILSSELQQAGQRVVAQSEGFKKFSTLSPPSRYNLCFTKSSTSDSRVSTCAGDSGSPLLLLNPVTKQYEVCGVVSFGTANCTSGEPSAFTYVPNYTNFIKHGYDSVSLANINDNMTLVQSAFKSYSIQMKPKSEAIWDYNKNQKKREENILKVDEDLVKHIIDYKNSQGGDKKESKLALLKLFLKAINNFICFLAQD